MCSRVLEPFHLWYYCTLPGYDASVSVCNATAAWRTPLLLFTCIVARCGLTRFPSAQSRVRCPYVFLCGIRYSQYLCHAHPAHSILPPLPLHQYCQHRADTRPLLLYRTSCTPRWQHILLRCSRRTSICLATDGTRGSAARSLHPTAGAAFRQRAILRIARLHGGPVDRFTHKFYCSFDFGTLL